MTSVAAASSLPVPATRKPTDWKSADMQGRIRNRYRSESAFKFMGFAALALATGFLLFLLFDIGSKGLSGFQRTDVSLTVVYDPQALALTPEQLKGPGAAEA